MLRHHQLPWIVLVIGLWVILVPISGFSAPPPQFPWFVAHFTIGPDHLPDGVSVGVEPNKTDGFPAEYLTISNISDTFLYLGALKSPYTVAPIPTPPVHLRSGNVPAFRLAWGKAYYWGLIWKGVQSETGWVLSDRGNSSDPLRLFVAGSVLTTVSGQTSYDLADLEFSIKYDEGGFRPADVKIPPPQGITLTMEYGDQDIKLPLTISYTPYEHYPPQRPLDSQLGCLIMVGVLLILPAWLVCLGVGFFVHPSSLGRTVRRVIKALTAVD